MNYELKMTGAIVNSFAGLTEAECAVLRGIQERIHGLNRRGGAMSRRVSASLGTLASY